MSTSVSLSVDRTYIGLTSLSLNTDGYKIGAGAEFFSGTFRRREIASPWVDGEMEIDHVASNVQMVIPVECRADTPLAVQAMVAELAEALSQPRFTVSLYLGSGFWQFACFPGDRQVDYSRERLHANQVLVVCTVPRLPHPLVGSTL